MSVSQTVMSHKGERREVAVEPVEYIFRIDAFTPETLPMARLAEYLAQLAKLIGHPDNTHLIRIESGSARLVHRVDAVDAPKVANRLSEITSGSGPREAQVALKKLDELLANDNAEGQLLEINGRVVIPFPGRNRPKPLAFPSVRQSGTIEGQVVSVGGKDKTAHVILQDGGVIYSGISLDRDAAKELAKFLYGPKLRLIGIGRWERTTDGMWKLIDFRVDKFELLDDRPLSETLNDLRNIPNNGLMKSSSYWDILGLRSDDGAVH